MNSTITPTATPAQLTAEQVNTALIDVRAVSKICGVSVRTVWTLNDRRRSPPPSALENRALAC